MKKLVGLALFLLILYGALLLADETARSWGNHLNLAKRIGQYGIISLGVGILIISGGIDLSIGSLVGLCATVFAMLLIDYHWPPALAMGATLLLGAAAGLLHGVIVTKLKMQAFVVTLCGLFIYRGLSLWIAGSQVKGLGSEFQTMKYVLAKNHLFFGLPVQLLIFLILAAIAAVFMHWSVYGRYLFAIGSNERAVLFSGVSIDRYKILAYVICSTLAAFFGILYLAEENAAQPSTTGNFLELYAIAGAVLGGCSLRGGDGTVLGIMIGTTILWILPNFSLMWGVPSDLKYAVIGSALFLGALIDEQLRQRGKAAKGK